MRQIKITKAIISQTYVSNSDLRKFSRNALNGCKAKRSKSANGVPHPITPLISLLGKQRSCCIGHPRTDGVPLIEGPRDVSGHEWWNAVIVFLFDHLVGTFFGDCLRGTLRTGRAAV
ncbi:hypothetical protein CEXT_673671 [Caerostris extrusa]|uniref:Uncharacterized protein n=1 Tax=Caerostris extrusa TaxID=172846 RepID=A0AAV4WWG2_CAEEX|nr:hypothetical protein CEXT_673671 [Caerostris extrusa]